MSRLVDLIQVDPSEISASREAKVLRSDKDNARKFETVMKGISHLVNLFFIAVGSMVHALLHMVTISRICSTTPSSLRCGYVAPPQPLGSAATAPPPTASPQCCGAKSG